MTELTDERLREVLHYGPGAREEAHELYMLTAHKYFGEFARGA